MLISVNARFIKKGEIEEMDEEDIKELVFNPRAVDFFYEFDNSSTWVFLAGGNDFVGECTVNEFKELMNTEELIVYEN